MPVTEHSHLDYHIFLWYLERLYLQISIKMVVKIAEHGQQPHQHCVVRALVRRCRRRRLCRAFLRAFNLIVYSKFIQKYWWLRSPDTFWEDEYSAYLVFPDGDLGGYHYNVTSSCGRTISPRCYKSRCIYYYSDERRCPCW